MPLGFWPNYQNTLDLLVKLPKCPSKVGMGFSWAFLGFSIWAFFYFGLLIIN
jgi:hypothetical protein